MGAFFNFQLRDDPDLVGWQSGVLYADGTPKPAYGLLEDAVQEPDAEDARAGSSVGLGPVVAEQDAAERAH